MEGNGKKETFLILKGQKAYSEFKPFLDTLPGEISVPSFVKEVNKEAIPQNKIPEGKKFFSVNEAFGLACKLLYERKAGVIWFTDENSELCELEVVYNDGFQGVHVYKFNEDNIWEEVWPKGCKFYFSEY